jgi:dihydropteroate synthase
MSSSRKARMGRELQWRDRTLIMGVLNVTPDSFFDGGNYATREKAIDHALRMAEDGADIIDVGGESSRPFSTPVSTDEELKRVVPVVEGIRESLSIPISVDTCKSKVAREACLAGADIVNDISGLMHDPEMADTVSTFKVKVVIMHMKGMPETMQVSPHYYDVIAEIGTFFAERLNFAAKNGIEKNNIILDPGIGFGKRVEDNLKIIKHLDTFKRFDLPLLVGTSMKGFIGRVSDSNMRGRIEGTLASIAISAWNGANIVRVHDVKKAKRVVGLVDAIREA